MGLNKVSRGAGIHVSILLVLFMCSNQPAAACPLAGDMEVCGTLFLPDYCQSDTSETVRKNIVSLDLLIMFPALGYSRIIPISKKTEVVLYGSITPYMDFLIDTGAAFAIGGKRHFFEPAGGYLFTENNIYLKAGYRFQGKRGLVLRVAPGYIITENVPWLTAGLGYAF